MDAYLTVYFGFIAEALAASALFYLAIYFAQKDNKDDVLSYLNITIGISSVAFLVGTLRILCVIIFGGEDFVELDGLGLVFFVFLPLAFSYFINKKIKENGFLAKNISKRFEADVRKDTEEESDLQFYITAMNEINNENKNEGLWIKCFAESDGDISKSEALYIRQRVNQLKSELVTTDYKES